MKSMLKIFGLILFPVFSMAQVNPLFLEPTKKQADSLRLELDKKLNDTLRMAAYRELALYYFDLNSDSAIYFIEKDLPLARSLKLKLWEADALDILGLVSSNQGNYVKSLQSFNAAQKIAEDPESEKNIWKISKFSDSQQPELARLSMLATILSDFNGLYSNTGNYDKEWSTLQECFKITSRINDNTLFSQANSSLGSIYSRQNKFDSALFFYKKALAYSDLAGYNKYRSAMYNAMGYVYSEKNLPALALSSYLSALQSCKEQNNFSGLGDTYNNLASYYHDLHIEDSALYYSKLGLATSLIAGRVRTTIKAYSTLASIYKSQHKADSAFLYLQLATTAKDSLFSMEKIKQVQNVGFDEQLRLQQLEKEKIEDQNKTRTYALLGGLGVFLAIGIILYRNNRQKQQANKVLESALNNLKATQSQLVQSEKMASLGELTAGIAHEIQNPLNFVNNFSEINRELLGEMKTELEKGDLEEAKTIARNIEENEEKISHHGKRADAIVKGMLQHSRAGNAVKEPTDINALADEYLRLAYHGIRAKDKNFNASLKTEFDSNIGRINIIPQDLGRVMLNLINNAFYAVDDKKRSALNEAIEDKYEPRVTVSTRKFNGKIEIRVIDNGKGIPQKVLDKIFQPFFTTKPTGVGTGLGLSLSYDIIRAHGGEIKVDTKEGEGTQFIIELPVN